MRIKTQLFGKTELANKTNEEQKQKREIIEYKKDRKNIKKLFK